MIFTNTITLLLALAPAAIFAAPTPTVKSIANVLAPRAIPAQALKALEDGSCDLSQAQMPLAPSPLPSPAAGLILAHVAIGRGTQNYTCASSSVTETPVAVGAIASLFNATCSAVRAPAVLADVTTLAINYAVPKTDIAQHLLSGHHEFTLAGAPLFILDTDMHNYGSIEAQKNATSAAPATASTGTNGLGSVPWLRLTASEGNFKEVFRINTAGGVAPKTCEGQPATIQVPYAAEYWFWA
ncbi:hypothetical protein K504DRAFT_397121 [Pleomassaria siparia CBS 279.74]|uniref:Malate dehydrogenase n=1 Tax=Pleomassaria siparia CBS 279.74 TaxID=1314801 RepID=A0A6G1KRY1_9PLEO|nr:hypothetical protein K504DRAFT_397121 [Pleomassaria siparia CBS 279.74]